MTKRLDKNRGYRNATTTKKNPSKKPATLCTPLSSHSLQTSKALHSTFLSPKIEYLHRRTPNFSSINSSYTKHIMTSYRTFSFTSFPALQHLQLKPHHLPATPRLRFSTMTKSYPSHPPTRFLTHSSTTPRQPPPSPSNHPSASPPPPP